MSKNLLLLIAACLGLLTVTSAKPVIEMRPAAVGRFYVAEFPSLARLTEYRATALIPAASAAAAVDPQPWELGGWDLGTAFLTAYFA